MALLEEAFISSIIIILCIDCVGIININNNNNALINNIHGRPHDLILPFKIPIDMRENFFEIYRQFGHAPSKRFARPVQGGLKFASHPV
jgi:hypothetical protein